MKGSRRFIILYVFLFVVCEAYGEISTGSGFTDSPESIQKKHGTPAQAGLRRNVSRLVPFAPDALKKHARGGHTDVLRIEQKIHDGSVQTSPHRDISRLVPLAPDALEKHTAGEHPDALRILQREHDSSVQTGPHADFYRSEIPLPVLPQPEAPVTPIVKKFKESPEVIYSRILSNAWKLYQAGRYVEAKREFDLVIKSTPDSSLRNNAYLGLGYTLRQLKMNKEALNAFTYLVMHKYRPGETVPVLMELLVYSHDWSEARKYLQRLPKGTRAGWAQRIDELQFREEYHRISMSSDREGLIALIDSYKHILSSCFMRDFYLTVASGLAKLKEYEKATSIYERLLECNRDDMDFSMLVHYEMETRFPYEQSLASVEKELQKYPLSEEYERALSDMRIRLLRKKLGQTDMESPVYRETAERILNIQPDDEEVRKGLAWSCYKRDDFQCSAHNFSVLLGNNPQKEEYLTGLVHSLIKAGDRDRALTLFEQAEVAPTEELTVLRQQLYFQEGDHHFREKNYQEAEYYLSRALDMNPGDKGAKPLLAWSYYHQDKLREAEKLFRELYRAEKTPQSAKNLLLVLDRTSPEDAEHFMLELSEEEEADLNIIAADWFYEHTAPIRAAQTYRGDDTCYQNCDSPMVELSGTYRHKSGDPGLSQLDVLAFPLKLHYPVMFGREWIFSITPIDLDSGLPPSEPYTGHFYRFLNDSSSPVHTLTHSVKVYEPEIRYHMEGPVKKEFMIGTTPLSGTIDPMVRFSGDFSKKDEWFINLHQASVKESILSYVGLEDPYGDEKWGRVLRTGVALGKSFPLTAPYWVSLDAGYDYYWGKNVIENNAVRGTVSTGRTENTGKGLTSLGLFMNVQHFERNSNFFTFGHGGYFSPDVFFLAGPFIRYTTKPCRDFWIDGQVSGGYMYYRTENAPHYHKVTENISTLNTAARNDFLGEYKGEEVSTLGIDARLKALKLIHEHVAIGGYVRANNTASYDEVGAGIVLHYYFNPIKKACHTWDQFPWPR